MTQATAPVTGSDAPTAPNLTPGSRIPNIVAALVFLFVLGVYGITMAPTVSFWDAGEYIACAYSLGLPHPPGTPLFIVVGRVFSLLPFRDPAFGVNLLTAVSGALAILFLHLSVVRIVRLWRQEGEDAGSRTWIALLSGATASLFAAFGATWWQNSIETEVYSPSAFLTTLCMWFMLKWAADPGRRGNRNYLLVVPYLLALGIGYHLGTYLIAPCFLLFILAVEPESFKDRRLWTWTIGLTLLGLSIHFFLPIRSKLNPNIDENNPETWSNFWYYVGRRQYRPPSIFDRQASWSYQFDMFWRYFAMQFPASLALLGLPGLIAHLRRDRRTFIMLGSFFMITSLGLIVYMNFTDHEVRERDYFYSPAFMAWAMWMGMGLGMGLEELRRMLAGRPSGQLRAGLAASTAAMLVIAMIPLQVNWEERDRRGDYNAFDYGYNMLVGLDKDAIIFTNGDNDTFPLWFQQEVMKFRTDVRIVNLSLLNTDWYIWQLKHIKPTIPMSVPDEQLPNLRPMQVDGKVMYVRDIAMQDIINTVNFTRPVYFAVTVPGLDEMGLTNNLTLEGMAFRLVRTKTRDMDLEITRRNMWDLFRYRGLLTPDGHLDMSVYRDENTAALVTNYSAAFIRMALEYERMGNFAEAVRNCERSGTISPDYPPYLSLMGPLYAQAGDFLKAEEFLKNRLKQSPTDSDLHVSLGYVYEQEGRTEDAIANYRRGVELDPNSSEAFRRLASQLLRVGRANEAIALLEKWLSLHPEDTSTQRALQELRREFAAPGGGESPAP